ncbi:chain length determinant protein EpsF [Methylomagnum sp.]
MSLPNILSVLLARWKLILSLTLGLALAALGVSLVTPKRYAAEAQLVIDAKSADPILGSILPPGTATNAITTQVDVINSDRVAQRVVRMLGFDQNPAIREEWQRQTGGKGSLEFWYGRVLKRRLIVVPTRESNVVTIGYAANDSRLAAAIANAFAQAYIDTNLELKVEPAKQYAGWFDERTRELREKLESAQRRLSNYQREHGIVAADERLDVENARLAELSTQLVQVQGFRSDARSRQSQSASAETLPEVLQNPLIQGLKTELARLEAQRGQLAGRFGANHPERAKNEAEVSALRQRVIAETRRIAGSLGTSHRINTARESDIQAALDAQKQKVLTLKAERDALAVLQHEADSAQKAFDLVTQRYAQTSLESEAQQTNVAVLTVATEPTQPSSPRVVLNTALGLLFGGVLGAGLALLLELFRPRLRGAGDVTEMLGVPVLAVLPTAKVARRPVGVGFSPRSGPTVAG